MVLAARRFLFLPAFTAIASTGESSGKGRFPPRGSQMAVDETIVRKIARLARIKVPDAALTPMAKELNNILQWVEQLDELKTDGVEPMTTSVSMKLPMREDKVTDGGYAKDIVKNAPGREDTFFTVPKVVE
jgi:aspartyl-tRNA(Asn)/glutamyl-tRNA(Gln) amidotransferase subunit C